ncbi:MAG: ATP-binding protein [Anaerolineales bacterium]|nr:ATP-binding protein [Anaerolineales bacterium]
MRLLVTGKTRSGKSSFLHLFLAHALRCRWRQVILLDGKGVELTPYREQTVVSALNGQMAAVHYAGPNALDKWELLLADVSTGLAHRFATLHERGLRAAAAADPRVLLVVDEVQVGCRDAQHGKGIKQALTHIAEQSAALGDVVVLTCQREQNSLPPAVRWNCNARLRMLGHGYFNYLPDGRPQLSGRLPYRTPEEVLGRLSEPLLGETAVAADNLLAVLGVAHGDDQTTERANATLYLGGDGWGKTYALQQHPTTGTVRTVFVDLQEPLRSWLTAIIEQAGAALPPRATAEQLRDLAVLAVRAEPTTLLLDNLDAANTKARVAIQLLINAATVAVLAAAPPDTATLQRKIHPFISRCRVVRIAPLTAAAAQKLADGSLPDNIPHRRATLRRIVTMGQGHPATIVALCQQAKEGTLPELRHLEHTPRRFNLVWVLLIPVIVLLLVWRYRLDSYLASALLITALMLLRPLIYRSVRQTT